MDKVYRDGQKFSLRNEDFNRIDAAVREAFLGMCSAYGIGQSDSFVLSGCEITEANGVLSVAAGFIALGGEICKVDAHTVAEHNAGSDPAGYDNFWLVAPTIDPGGTRPVEGGGTVNSWTYRKGKLVLEDTGLNATRYDLNLPTIHELGATKMAVNMASEINKLAVTMPNPTMLNGWTKSLFITSKDAFGNINIAATFNGIGASGTQLFVLPSGWKGITVAPTDVDAKTVNVLDDSISLPTGSIVTVNFSYKSIG
jgi:hypothetical protein